MSQIYPQPGTMLAGRYRVVRPIGRGGMGVVLEAKNTVTQRDVAIKWMLSDFVGSTEATERLMREAAAAARIRHPNVVDVYDVLQDGSSFFLVMDLLRGEPLAALLERADLPPHELIALLLPAMEGVAEAHRQDVIHRDIHPGNIFIAEEGRNARRVAKVLDFGISKLGGTSQPALTRSNISMGTPLYMSYEQLYSARDVDKRADVYSFGVILYEGLTGKPPFDGESFLEVAGKITAGNPIDPRELRPEIPDALAEIVLRAMARDRNARVESMEALIDGLQPFTEAHAFRAPTSENDERMAAAGSGPGGFVGDDEFEVVDRNRLVRGESARSLPPPLRGRSLDGSERIESDGPISRPLAQSAFGGTTSDGSTKSRRRTMLAVSSVVLVLVLGGGLWLSRARESAEVAIDDVTARPTSAPSDDSPTPPPALPKVAAPTPRPTPPANETVQGAPPIAPAPVVPASPPKPQPPWMQRWQANNAQRWQKPAPTPVPPTPAPGPDKHSPRAGDMRAEDL